MLCNNWSYYVEGFERQDLIGILNLDDASFSGNEKINFWSNAVINQLFGETESYVTASSGAFRTYTCSFINNGDVLFSSNFASGSLWVRSESVGGDVVEGTDYKVRELCCS